MASRESRSDLLHDLSASLVVVEARLALLQRAARDAVDPHELWCHANDGDEATPGVTLSAWSSRKIAKTAKREWKLARARLARGKA